MDFLSSIAWGTIIFWIVAVVGTFFAFGLIKAILNLRRVVPTNEVHIVQSSKGRIEYGKSPELSVGQTVETTGTIVQAHSNTYYEWPTWIPFLGVQVKILPLTVFDQDLEDYEAYDADRVPFQVHVKAFYRILNPRLAAERIEDMDDLKNQLEASLQGAIRSILAGSDIHAIMTGRKEFGDKFTDAVNEDLREWGITTVKSVELMNISDVTGSKVIHNIMQKKVSHIDKDSRIEVAKNQQAAQEAEIDSKQAVLIRAQDSEQAVGQRTAEVSKQVGIAQQAAQRDVNVAAKETMTTEMAVKEVAQIRAAEIHRSVAQVKAEEDKAVSVVNAEAQKSVQVITAEAQKAVVVTASVGEKERLENVATGQLTMATNEAKGIEAKGVAQGVAAKALAMAPVEAELALSTGIGQQKEYQDFVVRRDGVAKDQAIGVAQAGALEKAKIRVIATAGAPMDGLKSVGEAFSVQGGLKFGAMLEGLVNTPQGEMLLKKFGLARTAPTSEE